MSLEISKSYLQTRVEDQIKWMEDKSALNRRKYHLVKMLEIVAAAAIPFLAGFKFVGMAAITGFLGVFIVILNGLQQLYKYHENWITYRTTVESLKREKILFESQIEPYMGPESFQKFVQNFEALLANENKNWQTMSDQKEGEKV